MIVECAEEESNKTISTAINADIVARFPNKIVTNAMKMLHNPNAPSALKFLNTQPNSTQVFLVDI